MCNEKVEEHTAWREHIDFES